MKAKINGANIICTKNEGPKKFDHGFYGLPFPLFWHIDLAVRWFSLGSPCLFCLSFTVV